MAKGDAPPRRRLVASDSEDEAPPAPPAPDPPPDPDSDASPEVNWASVAQRLRYVVPAPPDPSADLDPDAHVLITDALSELRALDFVARDPAEVAAKLVEHDVLDAVFALLRDAPPPASSDEADPASDDASDDKENAAAAAASTAPDPTPEALKRARRIAMLRAKHAAVTLPALRALAHLLGAPGPIRRDVGSALLRVRTVFAHLDPRRGDPSNAVLEAALRALASVAVSSASAASRIALMCAGKDEAFPDGARWFVDRFAAFEPGKRRNAAAPSARVGAKAARLATLLLKTPANRAAMFGAWSEGAAAEDLEDSADAEPEPSAEASKSSEVVRRRPDLLAAAFRLYAESRGDPDARRRRRLEEAAKEARGASKGDPDPSAPDEAPVDEDAPFSDPGDDPSTRVFCLRIVAQACADAGGDALNGQLDSAREFVEAVQQGQVGMGDLRKKGMQGRRPLRLGCRHDPRHLGRRGRRVSPPVSEDAEPGEEASADGKQMCTCVTCDDGEALEMTVERGELLRRREGEGLRRGHGVARRNFAAHGCCDTSKGIAAVRTSQRAERASQLPVVAKSVGSRPAPSSQARRLTTLPLPKQNNSAT